MDVVLNTFLGPSGLSRAGQEYFRLLTKRNIRVIPRWLRLVPHDVQFVDPILREKMIKASGLTPTFGGNFCQFYVGLPNSVIVMPKRKFFIGSIVQEATKLRAYESFQIRHFDITLAPSTFCRNAYLSSGLDSKNVFYVPYPLNTQKWNPTIIPTHRKDDGVFRFLFMNTPFERKGIDLLIIAWLQEFKRGEPVELTIKTYQENKRVIPKNLIATIANKHRLSFSTSAPVRIYDQAMNDDELPSFMKSFDALVSPHRSEGFGMNPWYAMALGIPVICTNYGGTTDFAKQDLTWLVDVANFTTPSPSEAAIFESLRGIQWAEPDLECLKRQMRSCYNDSVARQQKAALAAEYVRDNFNDDIVENMLKDAMHSKRPDLWKELTETTVKVPPKMKDNKATLLEA